MKKFIIICLILITAYFIADYLYYYQGVYLPVRRASEPESFVMVQGKTIYLDEGNGPEPFEIRGVDMGVGIPGHFATDYAITKETYLRWFAWIQEMGANTIRVYTIHEPDFYDAFYEYNEGRSQPLYLIHGLWVNDYVQNSHVDAYDDSFRKTMLLDAKSLVDVLHGKRKLQLGRGIGSGSFDQDISQWVIGYILGVEWEDVTVAYTNHMQEDRSSYQGTYMYTTQEASPFEALLAEIGDKMMEYETIRYGQQRLVAFSNWPTTDPFDYPASISNAFFKIAKVDIEHIKLTGQVISGTFASYHIYPYYPDYLNFMPDSEQYTDSSGNLNTYYSYLKMINGHHTVPVIISEYGVPSSRGMAQIDTNTGRNQGGMSEKEQGAAIVQCYEDIMAAGCAGSIIFTWQDEWFKRTWNTMNYVNLNKTPYWSDYQTNEQYFGLLSFDPGKEKSVCYVDGDLSEWEPDDLVLEQDNASVSMKYDEKFLYFLIKKGGLSADKQVFLPIDTTPKSGSNYCENYKLKFSRGADFIVVIDGEDNSRVLVQERYNALRAMFRHETEKKDAYSDMPDLYSPKFDGIYMILQNNLREDRIKRDDVVVYSQEYDTYRTFETGRLTVGNANPSSENYNSMADLCFAGDAAEIKLPWQLLNFSNPSEMMIHDDYYEHYGVEELPIEELYVGITVPATKGQRIEMEPFALKGWGKKVTRHERLKDSYYMVQKMWSAG